MASYHVLNHYLPEELTLKVLEWTGGDFKKQMNEVIEDVLTRKFMIADTRFWDIVSSFTIWGNGNHLGYVDIADTDVMYTESIYMDIVEELEDATEQQWEDVEDILINVSRLGWSLYDAITVIYAFVLDSPMSDNEVALVGAFVAAYSELVNEEIAEFEAQAAEEANRMRVINMQVTPYNIDTDGFLIRDW
jgi:hypothetical protein